MRILLTILAAVAAVILVALVGVFLIEPPQPLIVKAEFVPEAITPNADGDTDVTRYTYELSENAIVSLVFESEIGEQFVFRDREQRVKDIEHTGLFSGVVDGYLLEGEVVEGEVMRRLMPDGNYTWTLTALPETGEPETRTGTFTITDSDAPLPEISTLSVSPQVFTPNQDGIRDRVQINVFLEKAADLNVYLVDASGLEIFVPPRFGETRDGEAGRYTYDYDGGVDLGADPPPDGEYVVTAVAQDAVGQQVRRTAEITIQSGGKPLAEIVNQPTGPDVIFTVESFDEAFASTAEAVGDLLLRPDDPQDVSLSDITMQVGDVLVFMLTIENYSDVPIRTHGAPPGTVYEQTQRAASLGDMDESGAWRVGLDCDTATSDYPWRWAVGDASILETVFDDETGNTYFYLPPGERSVVWGGVRMTELVPSRNPQNCYAALIHEDVGVTLRNLRVGARSVEMVDPDAPLYAD